MSIVIDIHTHPIFFESINEGAEKFEYRRQTMGLFKAGEAPLKHIFNQMNCAGIDKLTLLPLDLTTIDGHVPVSNDEIAALFKTAPDRFIGFASIDPHREDAIELLEFAFEELHLSGLKLHPSRQQFFPAEDLLEPIYRRSEEHTSELQYVSESRMPSSA